MFIKSVECKKCEAIVGYKPTIDRAIQTIIASTVVPLVRIVVYYKEVGQLTKLFFYTSNAPDEPGDKLLECTIPNDT